jgi:hypothetical protein
LEFPPICTPFDNATAELTPEPPRDPVALVEKVAIPPTDPVAALYVHKKNMDFGLPEPEYAGIVVLGVAAPQTPPVTVAVPETCAVGGEGLSATPVTGEEA